PAPPVRMPDRAPGVGDPSPFRVKAAIVLTPAVLSLTYTCVTCEAAAAPSGALTARQAARADIPAAATRRIKTRTTMSSLVPCGRSRPLEGLVCRARQALQ